MSNISDTATVTLQINGAQAKKVLDDIKTDLDNAKKKVEDLQNAKASPKDIEKAKKEVSKLQRKYDECRASVESVNDVLQNLDKVSLKNLDKTLKTLTKQFKDAEQGTEAYTELAGKIRIVREQIASVREELRESEGPWSRFKNWAMNAWPALDLLKGWYDTTISTLRGFVDAYAEMDQEMASVRKFTGMSEKEVAQLNEEFKKIDTRTSREELNRLAQEAGRLGKQSVEDVLGFVRAADKINVSLDDLGEGATLTLSKLTGTFGVEQQYGTEQSLLKVGSVINELSQNCSASAPYIANFTERMAGVGVQAKMTIPQIMGFAAVLDVNSQKVEASATALSQVLVRLYQDPAKYARVAGIDVANFTNMLEDDANKALIYFLETLNKAGGMDVLSPMFKDMGETGSRAIAALSTLAQNIDFVKAQQEAANLAFLEGTSIGDEFSVQNNTVAAGLDKCKNVAHEYQVELGERLYPLMSHFLSSTAAVARGLLTTIRYLSEHKVTVAALAVATMTYVTVLKLQSLWLDRVAVKTAFLDKWTKIHTVSTKALSGVIAAGRLVVAALTNAYQYLANGLRVTYFMQERWKKSIAAMNFGSWASLILSVATAVFLLARRINQASEAEKALDDIREKAAGRMEEQRLKIKALEEAAMDENRAMDERLALTAKLNSIIPDYNAQIDETTGKYMASKDALDDYLESLTRMYEVEGAQDKLREIGKEKAEIRTKLSKAQKDYEKARDFQTSGGGRAYTTSFGAVNYTAQDNVSSLKLEVSRHESDLAEVEKKERAILDVYAADIKKKLVKETLESEPSNISTPETLNSPARYNAHDANATNSVKDRFEEEKKWRERAEAEARISYAKGETTLSEHNEAMAMILRDYQQKLIDREDLSTDERLSVQADYWEAVNKLWISRIKAVEADENEEYEEILANLEANYAERLKLGNMSADEFKAAEKIHQEALERAELEHLARLADIYEPGSDDYLKAQKKLQDAEIAAARRHQQEMEALESEFAQIKKEYFGNNKAEDKALYDKQLTNLRIVYERELQAAQDNASERLRIEKAFLEAQKALRKMYNQDSEADTRSSMQKAVESSVEWLESDGGKALTGALSTLTSGMSSIFSGLSTMIQAELQVQTAAIESRYDKEIAYAEGNSYRIAKAEKEKEAAIAKAKNDANRKMFAMQVIQAVAQTATNALNAYGSAAAVPVVGYILAPIAAAMAVAAGAVQIAAIKKQQQASETQGYSKGGFTRPGAVDEPAGIVHAGEWVASQKLLASPVARPMIEALDYAQRTNTIGSLRSEDVSRSITAPQSISRIADGSPSAAVITEALASNSSVIGRLAKRLDEPFVTVNTVTGDHGINKKLNEYDTLMRNKSPKSRRKSPKSRRKNADIY